MRAWELFVLDVEGRICLMPMSLEGLPKHHSAAAGGRRGGTFWRGGLGVSRWTRNDWDLTHMSCGLKTFFSPRVTNLPIDISLLPQLPLSKYGRPQEHICAMQKGK